MNKMKYFLLLAVCTIAMGGMTSCLGSNDDESFDSRLTEEELSAYLTKLSGQYSGKLMFYYRGLNKAGTRDSMMLDSIENIRWVISRDSTIVIDNFPERVYNNAITGNADFRKILENAPEKQLVCHYSPYKGLTPNKIVDYGFFSLPNGTLKNNAMYTKTQITGEDNKQYEVEYGYVTYFTDGYYAYQANGYLSATYDIDFMLVMKDIQCPGVQGFTTEVFPILLKGAKIYTE